MRKTVIVTSILAALAGCHQTPVKEARIEAYARWNHTRAKVLCGVAQEHLKCGRLDLAALKAQEALALQPEFTEARVLLSRVCIEQGNYPVAIDQLTTLADEAPGSAEVHYLLGVAQEKNRQLADALESYRKAQVSSENNLPAIMAATEVLVAMDRLREAHHQIDSYMSLAGDEPGMYELAGRVAMLGGEYARAVQYYQQACDVDYKNEAYREMLARSQFHAGLYSNAIVTLQQLAQADKYRDQAWVHAMLGDCQMALNCAIKAREPYFRATQLSPAKAGVWAKLGQASLACDDVPQAIESAMAALRLDSASLDATLLLGYALLRDGQVTRSIRILTAATNRHPNSGTLYCLLGRAHATSGDRPQAMRCYAAALRVEPTNRLARELLSIAG